MLSRSVSKTLEQFPQNCQTGPRSCGIQVSMEDLSFKTVLIFTFSLLDNMKNFKGLYTCYISNSRAALQSRKWQLGSMS